MRVIAGEYRSRVLKEFKEIGVRPTSDMVRESLFNILSPIIYENSFLDLFCGSGAVGIEALSRGASRVVFVDNAKASVALTNENLKSLNRLERAENADAIGYLARVKEPFGIIFIDAPYQSDVGIKALQTIPATNALKDGGIVIYENEVPFTKQIEGLEKFDERRYGRAHLTFFKRNKL